MKKALVLLTAMCVTASYAFAAADDPVQMTAPKTDTVKTVTDAELNSSAPLGQQTDATTADDKAKTADAKKPKKHFHFHRKKIVVDYNKIAKLIEYNSFEEADNALQGAISRNHKDLRAQSLRVISLAKQCMLDPAQNNLDIMLRKHPGNSNLHYAQGVVYYQRTSSSNMAYIENTQKLLNDALSEFKKAIELDKKNARACNAAGVVLLNLGDTKGARAYFLQALAADKTYSMAIDNLGTMDFADGKAAEAEKKFKQALVYDTQNTTAMYHLGQVYMQKRDYATALTYLNNALAINQNSPAIYNLMGKAYVAQGNDAAAINAFKHSIFIKPEFSASYLDLADLYERRGDNELAIDQLKTALSVDSSDNETKLRLADISLVNNNYKQAISVYAELVDEDAYKNIAVKGLAQAYYGQAQKSATKATLGSSKDLYVALNYVNKALAANNQDLELHLAKLKLSKMTKQPYITQEDAKTIVQQQASDIGNKIVKGEAYLALHDFANAQKTFESTIDLSDNVDDQLYLSEIFVYNKQLNNAEKTYKKILKQDAQNKAATSGLEYVRKSKKYADDCFRSAQGFIKTKNLPAATDYLNRSVEVNPDNAQAYLLLGKVYEKQKDYTSAVANYKIYLDLQPYSNESKQIQKKVQIYDNRL